jgi:hypothetical protein
MVLVLAQLLGLRDASWVFVNMQLMKLRQSTVKTKEYTRKQPSFYFGFTLLKYPTM